MFAICCAIAPTAELKDHILTLCDDYAGNTGTLTVFIDSLSEIYDEADGLGYNDDSTSAPFANKTPYECSLLLKQMCEENTENCFFDGDIFAILDEQSLKDGTLLLVEEPEEEDGGEGNSVRAVFEMAETQMALWASGKTTIGEAKERAMKTEDGILRAGMDL